MARRALKNTDADNAQEVQIPEESTEVKNMAVPAGVDATKIAFVELDDAEVTVEKPRQRKNTAKAQYIEAVYSVANAFENGEVFRPSVQIADDKEKYRYQNWIREANKEIGKRGLVAQSEVLSRTDGKRFIRFTIHHMTDAERNAFENPSED